MTVAHLLACSGCARHVRAAEPRCPFCGHDLSETARAFVARQAPTQRLSRAALYAFGVGTLTVATACGGTVAGAEKGDKGGEAGVVDDSGTGAGDDAGVGQPVYGAPFDAAGIAPPYGISPPFDAGEEDDAGEPEDAAEPYDSGTAVPYGLPPEDAGFGDDDAGQTEDAGFPADARIAPPYGLPPGGDDAG